LICVDFGDFAAFRLDRPSPFETGPIGRSGTSPVSPILHGAAGAVIPGSAGSDGIVHAGPAAGQAGKTWNAVQSALWTGARGVPGSSSLSTLLRAHIGVVNGYRGGARCAAGRRGSGQCPVATLEQALNDNY
jgi:hypothetical protein